MPNQWLLRFAQNLKSQGGQSTYRPPHVRHWTNGSYYGPEYVSVKTQNSDVYCVVSDRSYTICLSAINFYRRIGTSEFFFSLLFSTRTMCTYYTPPSITIAWTTRWCYTHSHTHIVTIIVLLHSDSLRGAVVLPIWTYLRASTINRNNTGDPRVYYGLCAFTPSFIFCFDNNSPPGVAARTLYTDGPKRARTFVYGVRASFFRLTLKLWQWRGELFFKQVSYAKFRPTYQK